MGLAKTYKHVYSNFRISEFDYLQQVKGGVDKTRNMEHPGT